MSVCICEKPYPSVIRSGDICWYQCDFCGQLVTFSVHELIEEWAAIMEHDAKLPKGEAERLAAMDVRAAMFREGKAR